MSLGVLRYEIKALLFLLVVMCVCHYFSIICDVLMDSIAMMMSGLIVMYVITLKTMK